MGMSRQFAVPNATKLSLSISEENRKRLDQVSFDLRRKSSLNVPVAYLIDVIVRDADLKAVAAQIEAES
jgi:hypothetical protein